MGGNSQRNRRIDSFDAKIKQLNKTKELYKALDVYVIAESNRIIKFIKDMMISKHISYVSLAQKTGLGRESLYKIIPCNFDNKNQQNPNLLTLILILEACNLKIDIKENQSV